MLETGKLVYAASVGSGLGDNTSLDSGRGNNRVWNHGSTAVRNGTAKAGVEGLSEADAQRRNIAVRVAKLPMTKVLRARTISETRGFMKALVEADGDRILGFAMLGPEASEVTAVVQTAMLAGMPYTGLRDAIITHPTMAEALGGLFSNVPTG